MVGYGAEDNHFVIELTYNYGIGSYKLGNDFMVRHVFCPLHGLFTTEDTEKAFSSLYPKIR